MKKNRFQHGVSSLSKKNLSTRQNEQIINVGHFDHKIYNAKKSTFLFSQKNSTKQ